LSLSQSYNHIDRCDHETGAMHSNGWHSMDQYLYLKKVDEEFTEKEKEHVEN
jgi:hypothetical protein